MNPGDFRRVHLEFPIVIQKTAGFLLDIRELGMAAIRDKLE